jgi:hypothetical protein
MRHHVTEQGSEWRGGGRFEGTRVLPMGRFHKKLKSAPATRRSFSVIARTDGTDME